MYTYSYCQLQIGTCHGHLPFTSIGIKSHASAAADLQHPLKGVQGEERNEALWAQGKTGKTGLQRVSLSTKVLFRCLCQGLFTGEEEGNFEYDLPGHIQQSALPIPSISESIKLLQCFVQGLVKSTEIPDCDDSLHPKRVPAFMVRPRKVAVPLLSVHPLHDQCLLHLYPTHMTDLPTYLLQAPARDCFYQSGHEGHVPLLVSLVNNEHARMLSRFSLVQLLVTVWTIAHQSSLSLGFSRRKYWSRLPCPPPGDRLHPGFEHASPAASALQADSLFLSHQKSPNMMSIPPITVCPPSPWFPPAVPLPAYGLLLRDLSSDV